MKTRGSVIGIIGITIIIISLVVVVMIFPDDNPTMSGDIFLPGLLEDMFDRVSDEVLIFPDDFSLFSFSSMNSKVPLLWGLQIIDFQEGDRYSVSISNSFGDKFGNVEERGPIVFDMFEIPKTDIYNFEVTNLGDRPITVVMMFSEDPDNSEVFSDPNSPLVTTLIPLAISGILLIVGIFVTIVGIILFIMDWKKSKNDSGYY